MIASPGDVEFAPLAMVAFLDVIAVAPEQPMDGVRPEGQDSRQRRLEHQDSPFADVGPGGQQVPQKIFVAGMGDDQGVRLLMRAWAGFQIAHLLITMPAEPEQGRRAAWPGDPDHARPGDPGALKQGDERIARKQAARGLMDRRILGHRMQNSVDGGALGACLRVRIFALRPVRVR